MPVRPQTHGRPSAPPAWHPPDQFDDFELVRYLGAGGMGRVYLARDALLDRLVAIKFVSPDSPDPAAQERFPREARAVARLQHPNIVAAYRVGEVDGRPYFACEYIAGQRLDRLPRPMPWQRVLGIGIGLARALAAAHRSRILHRDIKPANIMVSDAGEVKLLDFGMAVLGDAAPGEPTPGAPAGDVRLTQAGTVIGTPLYLAPERWQGRPASERSDLYALGIVLYELLAGELPLARLTGDALVRAATDRDLAALEPRAPEVPRTLTRAIDRLVRRDPAGRPASAAEVRDELEALEALYRPFVADDGGGEADELAASFARVARAGDAMAARFYERWFAEAPEVRGLFRSDPAQQHRMLMASLKLTVDNLRRPERLVPMLEDLGRRHVGHAASLRHFASMGRCLLATLPAFDPAWSPALEQRWSAAVQRMLSVVQAGLEQAAASQPRALPRVDAGWRPPLAPPRTRWAETRGGAVAYQRFGAGPAELLLLGEWVTQVEAMWEHPAPARFLRGLAAGATVTALDRRGCGLSRREPRPTLDGWVDDALAVLDATSVDQPVVVGVGDGAAAAVMLAATHPARVRGLCLLGSGVCGAGRGADGPARLAEALRLLRERWGAPLFVEALAPGLAGDAGYRRWWAGLLRGGAGRAEAERMLRAGVAIDVAPVAPTIRVPTLVVHRREDAVSPVAEARRLADRIPGARLVELPGADHAPWSGDSEPLLAAVHEFVAGIPTAVLTTALAATVLVARLTRPDRRASKALAELFRRELALARGVPLPGGDEARRLGVFDAPGRAFACARSLSAAMSAGHHGVAVGVETGELQAGHELAGPVVDRAAALCDDAAPGAVALGATIRGLLASFTGGPEPEPPPR